MTEAADLTSLVGHVRSASLVDAMGRLYPHRCHVLDLVSPTPERTLFGPALTIGFVPYRVDLDLAGPYQFAALFYQAIEEAPADAVLVLAAGGHPHVSLGGGTKLSRVENEGLAGVLADGRLRDFDQLRRYRFVTYCRGETPFAGGGTVMPLVADVPVVFDRVTVLPGDYAYADRGGAVIIPGSDVRRVVETAAEIEAEDRQMVEQIRHEDPDDVRRRAGRSR
ncbi:MAG: RraA family protein [Actinomycetota bacterium]|nr:RraA family protein [Actinomycetota bacterium]